MVRSPSRKSPPTRPWRLGCGYKSGWVDLMYKSLVRTRLFSCACLCQVFSLFEHLPDLIPSHLCAGYKGPAEECNTVTAKTQLRFTWQMLCEGVSETCDVQLLCRDAIRRGVHLPKAWKSKWHLSADVPPVDALAHEAVHRARDEFSLSDATKLDCRLSCV